MTWTPELDGSYTYAPDATAFAVRFMRPRLAGGGVHSGVWADVCVTHQDKHLHEARYNLSSLSSRQGLAKYLAARADMPPPHDWNGVVEVACTRMCREMRRGKVIVNLSDLEDPGEPSYLVDRLVLENQVTIGFGNGESGKSLLACTVAYAVATGSGVLGLSARKQNVHYLDWETDENETRRRLQRIAWGLGSDKVPAVHYIGMDKPFAEDAETMRQINDGLVIMDSLGPACGGDVLRGEGPQEFWTATRQLHGCSLFVVAQTQKNPQGGKHTIFGSGMFNYMARSVWEIMGMSKDDTTHVAAFHRKANTGKKWQPIGWRYDFDDIARTVAISQEQPRTVLEFAATLPLQDQIAAIVTHGPASIPDLAAELDAKETTVKRVLYRYKNTRFVQQGNEWALLSDREDE